ncbi:hypothetical protein [Pseudomonas prosekii]|uniref:Phage tail protein n=1 Tax=Pseudomonas prosekii TaxID=1148509 RepID=A0A1H1S1L0_9PSED|nr:hypothetical protein [Pseudomonas prosekii]SDS41832.1 hypothetical protein SAMN05216222_1415 [Pseudomonas prosekii]
MNGIGGRTIAEAQENLTYPEFLVWMKFRQKRGSLHPGMRVETALARFQAFYANVKLPKDALRLHQEDFAPHMDPRVESLDEAVARWA